MESFETKLFIIPALTYSELTKRKFVNPKTSKKGGSQVATFTKLKAFLETFTDMFQPGHSFTKEDFKKKFSKLKIAQELNDLNTPSGDILRVCVLLGILEKQDKNYNVNPYEEWQVKLK